MLGEVMMQAKGKHSQLLWERRELLRIRAHMHKHQSGQAAGGMQLSLLVIWLKGAVWLFLT